MLSQKFNSFFLRVVNQRSKSRKNISLAIEQAKKFLIWHMNSKFYASTGKVVVENTLSSYLVYPCRVVIPSRYSCIFA